MRILAIALLFSTLLISCEKSPKCWGGNAYKGIGGAYSPSENCAILTEEEAFVINSEQDYLQLEQYLHGETNYCTLKDIDFEQYSLLGKSFYGTCKSRYVVEVTDDTENQQYVFRLKIRDCGNCSHSNYVENWVLVPKLPVGYKVLFKTDRR